MNLFQAVNSAIDIALETDSTYTISNSELKYLERMLNLVEYFDALLDYVKGMGLIEFLIPLYQSKVFSDSQSDWLYQDIPQLQRYNSEIISSLLSIK